MAKPFKIVNNPADTGDADHYGGVDIDNIASYLNDQSDAHTYTYLVYVDPTSGDYMARNGQTGVVDYTDAANVTAVLDSIVDNIDPLGTPTLIQLGPGDFNMTTIFDSIVSGSIGNITIRGCGMGVTNLIATSSIATGSVISILGAVSGSSNNLTGNAVEGALTVAATDGSAFAVGDTILLRSTAAFSAAGSAQGKKGEIHKIIDIATNTITLDHWAHDTYNTADTANIIKLATLKNILIEDLTLKAGSSYAATGKFFELRFIDNLRLNRVHVQNSLSTGVYIDSCINFNLDIVLEQTPGATFNSQYGLRVGCASENGKANVLGIGRWRHVITIDATSTANLEGQVRNVEFSGTAETTDEAVFDTHATGENISFRNCNVQASRSGAAGTTDAKGFQMRAKKCNIQNCNIWESVGKGITLSEDASGSIVSGCNIMRSRELPGNNTLGYGIEIRTGVNNCVINNNNIESSTREAILIRSTSLGHVITGNVINTSGAEGIDAADVTETVVSGNHITGCSKAINMTGSCDYWAITGNVFRVNTGGSTIIGAGTVNQNNVT